MITYLEGLPRSGKSLNCVKDYIVPALAKGRAVQAYVEGLNHEIIAKLAGITTTQCEVLLTTLTLDESEHIYKYYKPDSLIVIDEAESTFPHKRGSLDKEMYKFIATHGHFGLDIVLMGQNFSELHLNWRSRTEQKNFYLKRTAAGKPNEFSVTIQKPEMKGDKRVFKEVQHIKGIEYDTNYFGAYKSHTDDTENKETFIDERANVWNNPVLKKWAPVYLGVFVVSCYFVYNAFWGDTLTKSSSEMEAARNASNKTKIIRPAEPQSITPAATPVTNSPGQTVVTTTSSMKSKTPLFIDDNIVPDSPPDLIDNLSQTGRIRLTGYIRMGDKSDGWIEWRSDSFAVIERMSFNTLKILGWQVLVNQDANMAILQNYHKRYIATSWPLPDPKGFVTEKQNREIRPQDNSINTQVGLLDGSLRPSPK